MNREQLAHIVRAAATITSDGDILIVGSQAILATADASDLPIEATMSVEADVVFLDDPDDRKADLVDGVIGELSSFHELHGYYAQGVSMSTSVLPKGWRDRLVGLDRDDQHPGQAYCLEVHDLVVAKLVASRPKDVSFATALLESGLVDRNLLLERAETIDRPRAVVHRVLKSIDRCSGPENES